MTEDNSEFKVNEEASSEILLPPPPRTLHVGQANILNVDEGTDYRYRFLAHKMKSQRLDIVSVQEVSSPEQLQDRAREHGGFNGSVFVDSTSKRQSNYAYPFDDSVGILYNQDSLKNKGIVFQNHCAVDFSWLGARDGVLARFRDNTVTNADGAPSSIYVYSGHFAWNMVNEHKRMMQLRLLASLAEYLKQKDPTSVFIIASDVNTNDDTDGYGYVTGKTPGIEIPVDVQPKYYAALRGAAEAILSSTRTDENSSDLLLMPEAKGTFFVDAYTINEEENARLWATTDQSRSNNKWGKLTAKKFETTYPAMLPARRVDYVLSHGWVYGKRGCPVSYNRFGEPNPREGFNDHMSDHYGVSAKILL